MGFFISAGLHHCFPNSACLRKIRYGLRKRSILWHTDTNIIPSTAAAVAIGPRLRWASLRWSDCRLYRGYPTTIRFAFVDLSYYYPVFAYVCSSSIAEAFRRTLLAWCWFMISAVVASLPLLFLVGLLLETNPTQEVNVLSVAICFAGIIGMGFYTLSWTFGD